MRAFIFGFLFITLVAGCTNAFAAATALHIVNKSSYAINAIPYKVQWIPTAAGVAANSAQYVTRSVPWTASAFGGLAKTFLTSPGGIALSAALIGAGYLVDLVTGDVTSPGGGTVTQSYYFWYTNPSSSAYIQGFSALDAAQQAYGTWEAIQPGAEYRNISCPGGQVTQNCTADKYVNSAPDGGASLQMNYVNGTYEYEEPSSILTGEELAQVIEQSPYYNQYIPDILTDPYTGELIENQALQDQLADVESDFNAQYDSDPQTLPDSDPVNLDDALDSQEDQLTDCDLLPSLCKFMDWVQDDGGQTLDQTPPPDLNKQVDVSTYADFEGSPISFGGSGSCPPAYSLNVFGHSLEMEYTPFCDLSSMLNPLILAIATMTGIFYFVRIVSS